LSAGTDYLYTNDISCPVNNFTVHKDAALTVPFGSGANAPDYFFYDTVLHELSYRVDTASVYQIDAYIDGQTLFNQTASEVSHVRIRICGDQDIIFLSSGTATPSDVNVELQTNTVPGSTYTLSMTN
jgi:hypothetical protein